MNNMPLRLFSILLLAFCVACAETGPKLLMLYPKSSVDLEAHGICKHIVNTSPRAVAWIPVGSLDVWEGFDSRLPVLIVSPCK